MQINGQQFGHLLGRSTITHKLCDIMVFDIKNFFARFYNDTHINDGRRLIHKTEVV